MVDEPEFRSLIHAISVALVVRRVAEHCREKEWDLFY